MSGGVGNDTYFVDNAGDAVVENAGQGNDAVFASVNYGLSANVETLVLQGSADLQGYGNGLVNVIYGNTGNNLLDGGSPAPTSWSAAPATTPISSTTPATRRSRTPARATTRCFRPPTTGWRRTWKRLCCRAAPTCRATATTRRTRSTATPATTCSTAPAAPTSWMGGIGNDTYFVDNGLDQVVENPGAGTDVVFSTVHFILSANVETLVLQGCADLPGTGNALANSIFGNSGDDRLDGQGTADMLTGNAGNDTFVFIIGQGNGDAVVDFAGNGAAAGNSLQFVGYGAGATFTQNDATHWQVNFNGGASHEVIAFMNGASIHPTDVVFA